MEMIDEIRRMNFRQVRYQLNHERYTNLLFKNWLFNTDIDCTSNTQLCNDCVFSLDDLEVIDDCNEQRKSYCCSIKVCNTFELTKYQILNFIEHFHRNKSDCALVEVWNLLFTEEIFYF